MLRIRMRQKYDQYDCFHRYSPAFLRRRLITATIIMRAATIDRATVMTESASSQSKTRIADWLSQPELMLDTSVVLTIDVAFQICFCILMASRLSGTLRGLQSILLEITLWIPGLLLFPTLYSMLVAIIFSMPGADFDTIGWISGAAVMTATPERIQIRDGFFVPHILSEENSDKNDCPDKEKYQQHDNRNQQPC